MVSLLHFFVSAFLGFFVPTVHSFFVFAPTSRQSISFRDRRRCQSPDVAAPSIRESKQDPSVKTTAPDIGGIPCA